MKSIGNIAKYTILLLVLFATSCVEQSKVNIYNEAPFEVWKAMVLTDANVGEDVFEVQIRQLVNKRVNEYKERLKISLDDSICNNYRIKSEKVLSHIHEENGKRIESVISDVEAMEDSLLYYKRVDALVNNIEEEAQTYSNVKIEDIFEELIGEIDDKKNPDQRALDFISKLFIDAVIYQIQYPEIYTCKRIKDKEWEVMFETGYRLRAVGNNDGTYEYAFVTKPDVEYDVNKDFPGTNYGEIIVAAFKSIPDHSRIKEEDKNKLTEELYNLLAISWDLPNVEDIVGMIGENDFLYNFLSGNGGEDNNYERLDMVNIEKVSDKIKVTVKYNKRYLKDLYFKDVKNQLRLDDFSGFIDVLNDDLKDGFMFYRKSVKEDCERFVMNEIDRFNSGETERFLRENKVDEEKVKEFKVKFEKVIKSFDQALIGK